MFYLYNTMVRHNNNNQGMWFFKSDYFLGKNPPSVEEVQRALRRGDTSFISKLQYFSQTIKGSDGYWRSKALELEEWIHHHIGEGHGPPSYFITFSCAENWWPDLKRIVIELEANAGASQEYLDKLRDDGVIGFRAISHAVKQWPAQVNKFFVERSKDMLDNVLNEAIGLKHYWGRFEFAPGRGQIHVHLLGIADPTYLADYGSATTAQMKIEAVSKHARLWVDMTADLGEMNDDENYYASMENSHLKKRFSEVPDPDADVKNVAQDTMMHHCNTYCMRFAGKNKCRECNKNAGTERTLGKCDTPGFPLRDRDIIFTDRRGIKHYQMERGSSCRMVQLSKYILRTWRANCDIKLLVYDTDPKYPDIKEIENVIRYLVAYTVKKSSTISEEKNIIQDLITR